MTANEIYVVFVMTMLAIVFGGIIAIIVDQSDVKSYPKRKQYRHCKRWHWQW